MSEAFRVVNRYESSLLPRQETLCIKQNNRCVIYCTAEKDYWTYANFSDVLETVDASFFICHSRLVVNLNRIVSIRGGLLTFSGGMQLKMGRSALRRTKKAWMNFITE